MKCDSQHHACMCDCLPCKTDSCENCNMGNFPPYNNGDMCHEGCIACCGCEQKANEARDIAEGKIRELENQLHGAKYYDNLMALEHERKQVAHLSHRLEQVVEALEGYAIHQGWCAYLRAEIRRCDCPARYAVEALTPTPDVGKP